MIKQAIIPLARFGNRLLPLKSVFPKELLPTSGRPKIEYLVDECNDASIKEFICKIYIIIRFILSKLVKIKKGRT